MTKFTHREYEVELTFVPEEVMPEGGPFVPGSVIPAGYTITVDGRAWEGCRTTSKEEAMSDAKRRIDQMLTAADGTIRTKEQQKEYDAKYSAFDGDPWGIY